MKRILILFLLLMVICVSGCKKDEGTKRDKEIESDISENEETDEDDDKDLPDTNKGKTVVNDKTILVPKCEFADGNTLWGYVDPHNPDTYVIEPIFERADPFSGKYAVVVAKGEMAIIDKAGDYCIEPGTYRDFSPIGINTGFAMVYMANKWSLVDFDGNVYITVEDGTIEYYNELETFIVKSYEGQLSYFDLESKKFIDVDFPYDVIDYDNGIATAVKLSIFQELIPFYDDDSGLFGYVNKSGDVVIEPKFYNANAFSDGVAIVSIEDNKNGTDYYLTEHFGVINEKGDWVIEPQYYYIRKLGKDRLAVTPMSDYGTFMREYDSPFKKSELYDTSGNKLIDETYFNYKRISEDIISVSDGVNTFFINANGERLKDMPTIGYSGTVYLLEDIIAMEFPEANYADGAFDCLYYDLKGNLILSNTEKFLLNDEIVVESIIKMPCLGVIYSVPSFHIKSNPKLEQKLNSKVMEVLDEQIQYYDNIEELYLDETGYTSEDYSSFSVDLIGDVLSITWENYWYGFGAAHGNYGFNTYHINIRTAERYYLKDLFKVGVDYQTKLATIMKEHYFENADSFMYTDDPNEVFTLLKSDDYVFSVGNEGITIYFMPYDIAPYASGVIEFEISFDELENILDTEGTFYQSIMN